MSFTVRLCLKKKEGEKEKKGGKGRGERDKRGCSFQGVGFPPLVEDTVWCSGRKKRLLESQLLS